MFGLAGCRTTMFLDALEADFEPIRRSFIQSILYEVSCNRVRLVSQVECFIIPVSKSSLFLVVRSERLAVLTMVPESGL